MKPADYAVKALGFYSVYYGAVYFLTGDAPLVRLVYRAVKIPEVFPSVLLSGDFVSFPVVFAAFVMFILLYFIYRKRYFSNR